jgi:hypothetical protein
MAQMPSEPASPPTVPAFSNPSRLERRSGLMYAMEKSQQIAARWLYELGGWIFGALIAAALMVLQDLIPLGSSDRITVFAALACALAIPLHIAGLVIVRYVRDLQQAAREIAMAQNLTEGRGLLSDTTLSLQIFSPAKRRAMDMAVSTALFLGALFTLIGVATALWRISWVVTLLFFIASMLGLLLIVRAVRTPN